jgi:cystathionine beta-lyase
MDYDFDTPIDRRGGDSTKWRAWADRDVLPMWVADMDFASPPEVLAALHDRIRHGVFGYADVVESLEEAAVQWCGRRYDWEIRRQWLVWLPGVVPALNVAANAFAAPGQEILCCTPVYRPFRTAAANQGRRPVAVPLRRDAGERWMMDAAALAEAASADTRALALCHPHNPVGRAFARPELEEIVSLCRRRGLVLVSDEIHCDLVLDDVAHLPAAALSAEAAARTVTLMAPSKTFNLSGLGCAFAVIPDAGLRAAFTRAARGILAAPNVAGMVACEAALRHAEPWRCALLDYLRTNRDLLEDFVARELPGVTMTHVEATYLAWLDISALGWTDAAGHLERHGLGISDGAIFGAAPQTFVRINFGCPRATLEEACRRLRRAVRAETGCDTVQG